MAAKEAVAGGVLLAGGGAGGGYAAYKYINNNEEPEKPTDKESQPQPSGKKKIEDYLDSKTTSEEENKPITKVSESSSKDSWWSKAYNKYFLEIDGVNDEITNVGGKSSRETGAPSKFNDFKTGCQNLLGMEKDNPTDADADVVKAKKWCVTYKTVGSTDHKNKQLAENTDTKWDNKYTEVEKDATLKKVVDALKTSFSSEDETNQKKKATHKWCTMALDAGGSYSLKSKISTVCAFKN